MNRVEKVFGITLMTAALMLAGTAQAKKHVDEENGETTWASSDQAKCWPEVDALFDQETNSVSVESTKDLSNIVLLFADGSTQRFEDLSGLTDEFAGTGEHAGMLLTGIWIKSGCNSSGDGPGYGEFLENTSNVARLPVISIADAPGIIEPGLAEVAEVWFEVSLSEMVPLGSEPVVVNYTTRDGTTSAYDDYLPESGTLIFEPGSITQTVIVLVIDDRDYEPAEEFFHVDLSNPQNAQLAQVTGTGSIIDDDGGDY